MWVCTPSWLTRLSHWEWLAWGDPEFSVNTCASPRVPWSHLARPWGEGRGSGLKGGVKWVFAQALLSSGQAQAQPGTAGGPRHAGHVALSPSPLLGGGGGQ